MLLAVRRGNLELSVKMALNRVHSHAGFGLGRAKTIVGECLHSFPYIWVGMDLMHSDYSLDLDYSHANADDLNPVCICSPYAC